MIELKEDKNGLYLDIDNKIYRNKDICKVSIKNKACIAELELNSNGRFYLHQDEENGMRSPYYSPIFKYSWTFSIISFRSNTGESFSDDIVIIDIATKEDIEYREKVKECTCDEKGIIYKEAYIIKWFKQAYPSCCGSIILHNIVIQNPLNLSSEQYSIIKKVFDTFSFKLNFNCILRKDYQIDEIKFLTEKLGFRIIDEFKNPNSENILQILSYVQSE